MIRAITTADAPAAIGPYSQATEVGGAIYVSGQLPIDPEAATLEPDDITTQTRRCLSNVRSVLAAAGAELSAVAQVTVLLTSMQDFEAMNEVYAEFFTAPFPARAAYQVAALPRGARVEIAAIASAC